MKEFLDNLDINKQGSYDQDNDYIIDLNDSDEYGLIFSKLEKSADLELIDQLLTEDNALSVYTSNEFPYVVSLIADFYNDTYKLTIREVDND